VKEQQESSSRESRIRCLARVVGEARTRPEGWRSGPEVGDGWGREVGEMGRPKKDGAGIGIAEARDRQEEA
jgi:hypothetical protein